MDVRQNGQAEALGGFMAPKSYNDTPPPHSLHLYGHHLTRQRGLTYGCTCCGSQMWKPWEKPETRARCRRPMTLRS